MSTAASSPPLYAVPTPPPASRARFAFLLRLRELGRRAFDRAMAAPRAAAGYVMRALRTVVAGLPGPVTTALGWIGDRLSSTAALVRSVGVLPTIGAILTIPPVKRAVLGALRWVGRLTARAGAALWRGTKGLLGPLRLPRPDRRHPAHGARLAPVPLGQRGRGAPGCAAPAGGRQALCRTAPADGARHRRPSRAAVGAADRLASGAARGGWHAAPAGRPASRPRARRRQERPAIPDVRCPLRRGPRAASADGWLVTAGDAGGPAVAGGRPGRRGDASPRTPTNLATVRSAVSSSDRRHRPSAPADRDAEPITSDRARAAIAVRARSPPERNHHDRCSLHRRGRRPDRHRLRAPTQPVARGQRRRAHGPCASWRPSFWSASRPSKASSTSSLGMSALPLRRSAPPGATGAPTTTATATRTTDDRRNPGNALRTLRRLIEKTRRWPSTAAPSSTIGSGSCSPELEPAPVTWPRLCRFEGYRLVLRPLAVVKFGCCADLGRSLRPE